MGLSPEQVKKIAQLARLELGPAEIEKYKNQLSAILDFVEKLNELDVAGIEPTAHAISVPTPLRQDEARPFSGRDEALQGATDREGPFFRVPKVI